MTNDRVIFLVDKVTNEFGQVFPEDMRESLALELGVPSVPVVQSADLEDSKRRFEGVDTIFSTWNMPMLEADALPELFPNLRHLYYAAGSVKYFAEPFVRCGVELHSAASVNASPVAEYAAALIILASKGFFRSRVTTLNHFYRAKRAADLFPGNYHSTVGILGFGNVGREVASLLHERTELDLIAYDPYVDEGVCASLGVRETSLQGLFAASDVITNHLPDTEETRGMIAAELLSSMKPTATFINTGRGAQVNEAALARVLSSHPLQTAILDVTDPEPVRPWSRLLRRKNVYITPHVAGSLGNEKRRLGEAMLDEFHRVERGEPAIYAVNLDTMNRSA